MLQIPVLYKICGDLDFWSRAKPENCQTRKKMNYSGEATKEHHIDTLKMCFIKCCVCLIKQANEHN